MIKKNFVLLIVFLTIGLLFSSCEKQKSNFNYLHSFNFQDIEIYGYFSGTLLEVYVPYGTDYTNLIPLGEISEGAYIEPAFGQVINFSEDVIFTITAEDGTIQKYTVRVFVETFSDFEDLTLNSESFWNGSDASGKFQQAGADFINVFNSEWNSWSGFAYSNITNNTSGGYENQYSAYAGKGANNSSKYAVGYIFGKAEVLFQKVTLPQTVYVTNSTYAALSMKNGDAYSKKFGGTTGTDPDWFKLSIEGIDENGQVTDTVEFYLADFTASENVNDYIINTWAKVNLVNLGEVKKLNFWLTSTDVGLFGMNTPAYFCIDNLFGVVKKE